MTPAPPRRRRRALAGHLLRSTASVVLLTALFYWIPLGRGFGVLTVALLVLGLALFGGLVAWQTAAITHAAYPRLQMIADLIVVGVIAKVLLGAVRIGMRRRQGRTAAE